MIAAPLVDILRNPDFASKRMRQCRIPWDSNCDLAFRTLKARIASPPILVLPTWAHPFVLHTEASEIGAEAALTQDIDHLERVIAHASHKF